MARFKLPEPLKAWKVASSLPEKNGYPQYAITRKEADGSVTQAVLTQQEKEKSGQHDTDKCRAPGKEQTKEEGAQQQCPLQDDFHRCDLTGRARTLPPDSA